MQRVRRFGVLFHTSSQFAIYTRQISGYSVAYTPKSEVNNRMQWIWYILSGQQVSFSPKCFGIQCVCTDRRASASLLDLQKSFDQIEKIGLSSPYADSIRQCFTIQTNSDFYYSVYIYAGDEDYRGRAVQCNWQSQRVLAAYHNSSGRYVSAKCLIPCRIFCIFNGILIKRMIKKWEKLLLKNFAEGFFTRRFFPSFEYFFSSSALSLHFGFPYILKHACAQYSLLLLL